MLDSSTSPQGKPLPAEDAVPASTSPTARLIRRVHMFTGLFLAPWMMMYALSTLVMTHRDFVVSLYHSKNPDFIEERALDYSRTFPTSANREETANQILLDLGLPGRHYVSGGRNGQPL